MSYYNDLMKKATYEQRTILSKLRGLVAEESKLTKELSKYEPMQNEFPTCCRIRRDINEVQARIKKTVEDAKKYGVLVVPYDSLR